ALTFSHRDYRMYCKHQLQESIKSDFQKVLDGKQISVNILPPYLDEIAKTFKFKHVADNLMQIAIDFIKEHRSRYKIYTDGSMQQLNNAWHSLDNTSIITFSIVPS